MHMKQWETFVLVQHLSLTSYQDHILWDKVLILKFLASGELATSAIMAHDSWNNSMKERTLLTKPILDSSSTTMSK